MASAGRTGEAVGLLRNKPGAVRSSREPPRSVASEATGLHGSELVYCRQCATWVAVSATRELSTHPTSRGVVTYFRCSSGHADFNRTSTAPPRTGHEDVANRPVTNAINGTEERETNMTNTDVTSISELPRLLEQAMRDESASAVAALFTEDGTFWIADDRTPTGAAASGKEEIEQLFAGWFGAVGLRLAIEEPTHSVSLDEERMLQSGVFTRTITVRETGDDVEERGGYVRLIRKLNGRWKYQVLSVVALQARP